MAQDYRSYNGQPPAPRPLPDRPATHSGDTHTPDSPDPGYADMTVAELKAEAAARGVEVESGARKQDYVDALTEADR